MQVYSGKTFISFFCTLFSRICSFMCGYPMHLDGDEIQLVVMVLLSISCALVGTVLYLRKLAMLAHSLSHTILLGIVLAFIAVSVWSRVHNFSLNMPILLLAAFFTSVLTGCATCACVRYLRLPYDASTGFVFSTLFALGVVAVSIFTSNTHIGVESVMGNVDLLHFDDIYTALFLLLINIAVILLLYRPLFVSTFDFFFAETIGIRGRLLEYILLFLTSATVMGSFRAVGVVLVLSLLITPSLCARLLTHRMCHMLWIAPVVGALTSVMGVALGRHIYTVYQVPLSTGGLIVTLQGVVYGLLGALKTYSNTNGWNRRKSSHVLLCDRAKQVHTES